MQPFVPHSDKRAWDRSKLGQYARTDWINAAQEMAFGDQLIEVECVKQSALIASLLPHHPEPPLLYFQATESQLGADHQPFFNME